MNTFHNTRAFRHSPANATIVSSAVLAASALYLRFLSKRFWYSSFFLLLVFLQAIYSWAEQTYSVSGLVLKVDKAHQILVVSCQSIPGYMDAMVMPYPVLEAKELDGLAPGSVVDFTLVVNNTKAYAEKVRIRGFQSLEQDPLTARRLKILNGILDSKPAAKPLDIGEPVPEFVLTDQNGRQVALLQFSGEVVVMNFIYTRCTLPNYCFRLSNNLGQLQKRFKNRMGSDLVLVTVTFDPAHDTPEAMAHYASIWKADLKTWHFLTGPTADIERVCNLFGVDFFPEEGLFDHSLHTAIIGRDGRLVANLEGNAFSAKQLGDLVETTLDSSPKIAHR